MMLLYLAIGKIGKNNIVIGLMDFEFMGGSMGRAVGGAIVKAAQNSQLKINNLLFFLQVQGEQECRKE